MQVLLVHSVPLASQGGAEISLRQHVAAAPAHVSVDTVLPDADVDLSRYDAVILANLRPTAPRTDGAGARWKQSVWQWISQSKMNAIAWRSEIAWAVRWRQLLMGYPGAVIRSERDIHPCARRDGQCLTGNPPCKTECDCADTVTQAFQALINICDAVQFLSPMHRDAINQLVRIDARQYVIAPPLDLVRFTNTTPWAQRKRAALITGDEIRVSETAIQRARKAGYEAETISYQSVPHADMPALLNSYQAVVVDPVMLHAFGRLAAEAMACGCEVLASDRVGAMSWDDPVAACREANDRFWTMVEQVTAASNPRRAKAQSTAEPRSAA